MGHHSCAYNAFSFYRVSFSFISCLTKMSLMTSLTIMVMGLGLPDNMDYLVHSFLYFLKFQFIVFLDCHVMGSQNTVVMSVEYFQSEYFPLKNFSGFKFIFLNMITVCFRLSHSFKTMDRRKSVSVQASPLYRSSSPLW